MQGQIPKIAERWLCEEMTGHWVPDESVFWRFAEHKQELKVTAIGKDRRL